MTIKPITLVLATLGLIVGSMTATATAAGFPEKDITLVIPYRAGGGYDVYARATARSMKKYLPNNVNVVPKNVSGAGGNKGAAFIYRSKPDGYTIGLVNVVGATVSQILGRKVGFDINKMTWLGRIASDKYVLVVTKNSPVKTLADLQKAKKTPRFVNMSAGASQYLSYKVATSVLGLKTQDISGYRSMPAVLVGLIRGDGDVAVTAVGTSRQYINNGDIRAIAIFDSQSSFKGVPTATQLGYPNLAFLGLERVVGAPPGVPENIRSILETALLKALRDPELVAWSKKTKRLIHPLAGSGVKDALEKRTAFYLQYKDLLGKKKK